MAKDIFMPQVLEKTEPIEGAINSIKKLSQNFEIYIITARTEEMLPYVKKWLKKYDIDKNIKKVMSSSFEKKQDICFKNDICFLCDDDFRHIIDKKVEFRVLFSKYKFTENEDFFNAKSWQEIEKILLDS